MPCLKKFPDYSYKIVWFASILLLLWSVSFSALAAHDEFSIDDIIVDSDGKDTNDARTKALSQGEVDAFRQYVGKRNPAKSADIIAKTSSSDITRLISGFEILEEKITPNHYHATLRYNFSPLAVRAMLPPPEGQQQKEDAEHHQSKAVLVIPVYKEGNTLKLWQDDNKWRNIWYESALEASGGIVIMPLGDLDDRVDVDDANVENATTASLARMYGRYGVGEIYIVFAYYNKKADPKPTLEVTLKRLLPLPGKDETSRMDYIIRSSENLDTLMARASGDIAQHLYKIQTINPNKIEYDRLKEINARVNTTDIHEWQALRQKLLAHGNIVGIKVTSISFYETQMVITFKGTPDMLGKTLVASGLRVMQDGNDLVLILK